MAYRIKRADGTYWAKTPGGMPGYGFNKGEPVQFATKAKAEHAATRTQIGKRHAKGMALEVEEAPDGRV